MTSIVRLPRLEWGDPDAPRHALLVHGLGSNGALMWRFGVALAEAGWCATAVDLRGHGTAPRALDYTLEAYAADVAATRSRRGGAPWDLAVGHSLGGAAVTLAAAQHPGWARRLVLIDPGLRLTDEQRDTVRASQEEAFADGTVDAVRARNPHWHENDVELKALSTAQVSRWAVEQTAAQNPGWDVSGPARTLDVPTHIIGADPAVWSIFTGALADEVCANPLVSMSVVAGAGHSPQRDRPDETMRQFFAAID
ncbi:alpha/beta fold hydrolase [Microbacterium xanthum]|uniref:alpha/beta fold hydrolase n=1 Tax=Microbacterium xanthum TaxID=3079794 RepID=UPI002AD548E6|nr:MULTISPECIES: alpha/beta hydrolase [unclassified Microbacterium]MDZ8170790.1 alpha/beta hydrolase [Microbacterium sp. KSW-48]MDZ8201299.1 alpha/beta hydrolase [Microbacterium sp. SSW1-59]